MMGAVVVVPVVEAMLKRLPDAAVGLFGQSYGLLVRGKAHIARGGGLCGSSRTCYKGCCKSCVEMSHKLCYFGSCKEFLIVVLYL